MFSVSGVLELAWEPPLLPHWQFEISHIQVGIVVKNPLANARDMRHSFDPWVGKIL